MDLRRRIKDEIEKLISNENFYGKAVAVSIVDYSGPNIKGIFRDLSSNRIFQFEITKDMKVIYKPSIDAKDNESESNAIRRLDAYSAGFSSVVFQEGFSAKASESLKPENSSLPANVYRCGAKNVNIKGTCTIKTNDINVNSKISSLFEIKNNLTANPKH